MQYKYRWTKFHCITMQFQYNSSSSIGCKQNHPHTIITYLMTCRGTRSKSWAYLSLKLAKSSPLSVQSMVHCLISSLNTMLYIFCSFFTISSKLWIWVGPLSSVLSSSIPARESIASNACFNFKTSCRPVGFIDGKMVRCSSCCLRWVVWRSSKNSRPRTPGSFTRWYSDGTNVLGIWVAA